MRKDEAQKVVLACATFDPDGKVMLTTDGVFPSREITDYHERARVPGAGGTDVCSLLTTGSIPAIRSFYGSSRPRLIGSQLAISFAA